MIEIDGIKLDEEIIQTKFSCDLKKCKGACCTFYGEYGAPVLDEEIKKMQDSLPIASKYLSKTSLEYIEKHGITEGVPGDYTTVCINNRDCVFVYYEGDIAFCALEKAYFAGEIDFRKPISCHFFPVRKAFWDDGHLYLQRINECESGYEKGNKENISLIKSLKEVFIRNYGANWYENFVNYIKKLS